MAGLPPTGMTPGAPPPGGSPMPAPGGAPPPGIGIPPGIPPMAPMGRPTPPPPNGLGSGSPFGQLLSDLSADMGPGWQMIDVAVRTLKLARKTADLQKSPKVVAVVTSTVETLTTLLSHYTAGHGGVPQGMVSEPDVRGDTDSSNPPADAAGEPGSDDGQ